jgi:glyoxylase-like metal-dependent hydrolase (beta-lactamase superfamily II)
MTNFGLSRRQALLGASAVAGIGALDGMRLPAALAKAPISKEQAPYFYRFNHGSMQATVVSDGPIPLGDPSGAFLGASKEEISKLLTDNFLSPTNAVLEQNILVVNTGDKLLLVDTGMGSSTMFGPTTGKMLASLKAAGIDPKDIDGVLATHAHCDHVWGIMGDDGKANFPNAQIYISQEDFDYWTDEKKLAMKQPEFMQPFVEGARKNLLPVRDRIVFVKDGQEFLPGIQAIATPGHTVGHMIFMITSDGKSLAAIGDLTHHQILLVEKPRFEFAYDTDPKQSANSRVRILDMLAAQKIPLVAYHFPWPGHGHVAKHGDGFRYHPAPMQMVLDMKT